MNTLPALPAPDLEREIAALARDYARANGPVMALINRLGGQIEARLDALPAGLRREMTEVTGRALEAAFGLGGKAPDLGGRGRMAAVVASGAAGGAAGLASTLVELPVTVTLLLQAVRAEAVAAGFDAEAPEVRAACLEVFGAGTPLSRDDGANTAFFSARFALSGPSLQKLIATVAPRLVIALGPKLAAQAVPVIGAVTGAALNAAYLGYYREIARIRFALMRLSVRYGGEVVVAAFVEAAERDLPVRR